MYTYIPTIFARIQQRITFYSGDTLVCQAWPPFDVLRFTRKSCFFLKMSFKLMQPLYGSGSLTEQISVNSLQVPRVDDHKSHGSTYNNCC